MCLVDIGLLFHYSIFFCLYVVIKIVEQNWYFCQGFVEEEQDFVLSPLGYSVTLAIMAEGARGETRNQLVSALHLPEDTYAVRQNYKTVLQSMTVSIITVKQFGSIVNKYSYQNIGSLLIAQVLGSIVNFGFT